MAVVLEYVRKIPGWCPNNDAFLMNTPLDPESPEDFRGNGATLPLRIIAPPLMLLLPLLPAIVFIGYTLMIPVFLPSTGVQTAVETLLVGVPAVVLILYGRWTSHALSSTLAGAFLYPLFGIYSQILALLFVPVFMLTPAIHWLNFNLLVGTVPFVVLFGAMGFFSSRKTTISFLIAVAFGALAIAIVWGIR